MAQIFLTGASGLVGSRLLPRLMASGHECRALVRGAALLPDGATPVRGDLLQPESLTGALRDVEAVVHLAALFRTPDEEAIWRANRDGTRNLIDVVLADAPGARFVMASTSNVYNADQQRPGREEDECRPDAPYPASKVVAEGLLRESGLTWAIPRFPFVYGDGDGHLESMPAMVERYEMHPARSFSVAHHRDIAQIIELALAGALDGEIVNVTDDAPLTVYEMAAIAGDPIAGSHESLPNPWSGRVDGALARRHGFAPTVPTVHQAVRDGLL